jgi:NADPH:quinone reductase-like Zn-dependent oxidoreductase
MKAFVLAGNGIENLKIKDVPIPLQGDGDVLIKTRAVSLNPVDIKAITMEGVRTGLYAPAPGQDIIMGWDIAGDVMCIGPSVINLKPGDRVFGCASFPGQGDGFAEYVRAPAAHLAIIPENVSYAAAAASTMAALTAWLAIVTTGLVSKNDKVLINGAAGGVGHFAVQIAKSFGAYVIGTASAKNLDFVKSIGADQVIDYKAVKFEQVVKDADLVMDSIDDANLSRSLDAVKRGGRVVSLIATFEEENAAKAYAKNVQGTRIGVRSNGADMASIAALLGNGAIKPAIFKTYKFEDLAKAASDMATISFGKLVVTLD